MRIYFTCKILCAICVAVSASIDNDECYGERPKDTNGVCLGYSGQVCSSDNECDTELGYTCVKQENNTYMCAGSCNLRAEKIQQTSVKLLWDNFKPQNYMYEYSVAVTQEFSTDFQTWRKYEVGVEPTTVIPELMPGSLYFIVVSIWTDSSFTKYSKSSEVIMVTTKGVTACEHNGEEISVGEKVQVECEDICTCIPTGEMDCIPVCKQYDDLSNEMKDPSSPCRQEQSKDGCCTIITCDPTAATSNDKAATPWQLDNFVTMAMENISTTDVLIRLTYDDPPQVTDLYLCIRMANHENSTHKMLIGPHEHYTQIRGLKPATEYVLWVEFVVKETEVMSQELRIQTFPNNTNQVQEVSDTKKYPEGGQNSSILLGLIGGIVGIIVVLAIVLVLIMHHHKMKSRQPLSFENKMFGITASTQQDSAMHM